MKIIVRLVILILGLSGALEITAQPTNDDCLNATPIAYASYCTFATYSNTAATASAGAPAPGCANYTTGDVWFSAVVPASGHLIFDSQTGSLTDCGMAVYSGSCAGLSLIYCDDDNSMNGAMPYIDASGLTVGSTVYVRMWENGGDAFGTFGVCAYEPVSTPGCGSNAAAGDYCATSVPICNLNGYCGNTSSTYGYTVSPTNSSDENDNLASWMDSNNPFCGSIENNSWLSFVADATTATLDLNVSNCSMGYGIQMQIYSTSDCYNYTPVSNCYNPGSVVNGIVTATGLTIGQTYYIMIDGNAGDVCDYVMSAASGVFIIDAGEDVTICGGQSTTLNGSGATSYSWSPPTGLSDPHIANPIATPTTTTTYTLIGSGNCPGTNSDAVTVTVGGLTPTAGNNGPLCPGATLNLTSTPAAATSYSWTGPDGFTSNLQNPTIASVTPVVSGTYTVTVENGGCSGTATTDVTVNSASAIVASSNGPICAGSDLSLDVSPSGAASYSWSGPNGSSTNNQSPTISNATTAATGTYIVVVTFAGGCSGADTIDVTVSTDLTPTVGSNSPICTSGTLNLTSSGGATYSWSGPDGFTSNQQNPVIAGVTSANSGTYTVTATDSSGCSGSASTTISISSVPLADFSYNGPYCPGDADPFPILAPGASSGVYSSTSGLVFISTVSGNVDLSESTPGSYTVTNTIPASGGCPQNTATAILTINHFSNINFLATPLSGCEPLNVDFLFVPGSNIVDDSWLWNFDDHGSTSADSMTSHVFTEPGIYVVTLTAQTTGSCDAASSVTITVAPIPEADFLAHPVIVTTDDPVVNFIDYSTNATNWLWDFGDPGSITFNSSTLQNPDHYFSAAGEYTVLLTVSNIAGCADTVTGLISVNDAFAFFIPNAFTPNEDGLNTLFGPKGIGYLENTFIMRIFDRWGKTLYYTEDIEKGWNGTDYNTGKLQHVGVYTYMIEITDASLHPHKYVGTLTLVY